MADPTSRLTRIEARTPTVVRAVTMVTDEGVTVTVAGVEMTEAQFKRRYRGREVFNRVYLLGDAEWTGR